MASKNNTNLKKKNIKKAFNVNFKNMVGTCCATCTATGYLCSYLRPVNLNLKKNFMYFGFVLRYLGTNRQTASLII